MADKIQEALERNLINVPFAGFYYTFYDQEVDRCMELEASNQCELTDIEESEVMDLLHRYSNFTTCFDTIARKYVDRFCEQFEREFGIDLELEFHEMISPREYNFTTDRIFAWVPEEKAALLYEQVNKNILAGTIDRHLKSRDGFSSFYMDFVYDWRDTPLEDWDCNELGMLLYAFVSDSEDFNFRVFESMYEDIDNAWQNCVDWDKFEEKRDELQTASVE